MILFGLYGIIYGITEAVLWSRRGANAFKWNEHILLVTARTIPAFCFLFNPIVYELISIELLSIAIHPFAYYEGRKRIDGSYPKGWLSEPGKDSTALTNLKLWQRTLLLVLSLVFYFLVPHIVNAKHFLMVQL